MNVILHAINSYTGHFIKTKGGLYLISADGKSTIWIREDDFDAIIRSLLFV